ncbi:MAG: isoleucine--tRNA ligase [Candidatus Omnitrophica bacterium]|nr:isoleucine--tRNA ligase [Candidatus Omnitrophota bacterium]
MDYKSTLNLPTTTFSMKADLPQKEPLYLKKWEAMDIYGTIRKLRGGSRKYILHDGPPYANGHIHMGHVLNKILKDIVVKYKTMKGYDAPYVPGWDCHGLPVEHQLLKELKIRKGELDQVKFRQQARDYALKFVDIQKKEFKRLGIFGDWEKPYLTLDPRYEAAILRSFAALAKEGYIYKDLKPVNWCTTCETALAEAEVEYEDHVSPSIYLKFRVKRFDSKSALGQVNPENMFFVIWTTTPWTLLANVAIAVHPDLDYTFAVSGTETWIMLAGLAEDLMKKLDRPYTPVRTVKGRDFEGSIAEHPFINRESTVVSAGYVSSDEGTGCVHTAPGHGQDDYLTGKKYRLPLLMPVDGKGHFDATCGEFSGMNVHAANDPIIEKMRSNGSLVLAGSVPHSYPHCWRCKKPIIFRATEQWFLKVDHKDLRKRILKAIEHDVAWHPGAGMSRIKAMVENRPDWCLSRQRYWGVPIPAYYCKECHERIVDPQAIMKLAERVLKEGVDIWFTESAGSFLPGGFSCPRCKSRAIDAERDILDVWFESGVSHQAVLKDNPGMGYPADLYLEGSDQHRGWFQSAIITGIGIDNRPPYRTVLTHGFIVDGVGKKMSKSLGNTVAPEDLMKKYGADILRLWVASSNYSDDVRVSPEIIERTADAYRKIRNTFRYLISNLYDFDPLKDIVGDIRAMDDIDRWMLSRLALLVKDVEEAYETFTFHKVYREIYDFCVDEVSSLYLDIAKDRLYTFAKASTERRSAQTVLYWILDCLERMLAPILCFTTEEIWQSVPSLKSREGVETVHGSAWPYPDSRRGQLNGYADRELEERFKTLVTIRGAVQKALEEKRAKGEIGSSLDAHVLVFVREGAARETVKKSSPILERFFIVSHVTIVDEPPRGASGFPEAGIDVAVEKASGVKCARCWHYRPSVGRDRAHPELCDICVRNI